MTDRSASNDSALVEVLEQSQQLGFLGARPIDEVIEHSRAFVAAIQEIGDGGSVIDMGSGGGVPGLVLAHDLPGLRLDLIDRRAKRTDFLARVVRRLGWSDRVTVTCADVDDVGRIRPRVADIVVARGFGPPDVTVVRSSPLGGAVVVFLVGTPPSAHN